MGEALVLCSIFTCLIARRHSSWNADPLQVTT
jgi:hypothetical protein